jgi:hypothetical protein
MQEFDLVHFWMLGVMGVMVIFFFAAVYGHFYNRNNHQDNYQHGNHRNSHEQYKYGKKII